MTSNNSVLVPYMTNHADGLAYWPDENCSGCQGFRLWSPDGLSREFRSECGQLGLRLYVEQNTNYHVHCKFCISLALAILSSRPQLRIHVPFRGATSWIAPPAIVSPHSGMSSQGVGIPLQQTGPSASCTPQQFPCYGLTRQQFNATGAQSEMSQQAQHGDGDSSGETSVAVKKQKMDPQYMTERKLGSEVEYHCMHAALLSAWVTDSTVIVAWSY